MDTLALNWLIGITGFALGLFACVLLAIVEYGAWALVLPPRGRKEAAEGTTEAGTPIAAVAADGARLAGRSYQANGVSTGRTALLLHGFAESSGALQAERTESLRQAGWNVAVLDSRGYGESGGPYASFGGREAGDVSAWLDAMETTLGPGLPLVPVLWGRSMGAAIALRAAAKDSRVRSLVLESPMVDLNDAMAVWFRRRRAPLPRLLARLVTRRAGRIAGVSLTRPNALQVAPLVRLPVLILHGADDSLVSPGQARRLAAAFPEPARLIEVPGAGHADVVDVGGQPLLTQVTRFLAY